MKLFKRKAITTPIVDQHTDIRAAADTYITRVCEAIINLDPDDGTLAPEQICRRYSSKLIVQFYIRKDYALFVKTANSRIKAEPQEGNQIVIETISYDVVGTYIATTKCGILLRDWAIRKGIQQ